MPRTIRTSSDTLEQLTDRIATTPHIRRALLNGEVLALYHDKAKGFYRLTKQKHIPTKKEKTE